MTAVDNDGDGDCFPESFIVHYPGLTADEVREKVYTRLISSPDRPKYEESFRTLLISDEATHLASSYQKHVDGLKVGLLPKQYFTSLEIEVMLDEFDCHARFYSATGIYEIRSTKPGASKFPVYQFARLEDPHTF